MGCSCFYMSIHHNVGLHPFIGGLPLTSSVELSTLAPRWGPYLALRPACFFSLKSLLGK